MWVIIKTIQEIASEALFRKRRWANAKELFRAASAALHWVWNVEHDIGVVLGVFLGVGPRQLRHLYLHSTSMSRKYIDERTLAA